MRAKQLETIAGELAGMALGIRSRGKPNKTAAPDGHALPPLFPLFPLFPWSGGTRFLVRAPASRYAVVGLKKEEKEPK